jgi:hypothetical protein
VSGEDVDVATASDVSAIAAVVAVPRAGRPPRSTAGAARCSRAERRCADDPRRAATDAAPVKVAAGAAAATALLTATVVGLHGPAAVLAVLGEAVVAALVRDRAAQPLRHGHGPGARCRGLAGGRSRGRADRDR